MLPHRWIAERTLAWFGRYRPIPEKNYKYFPNIETFLKRASPNQTAVDVIALLSQQPDCGLAHYPSQRSRMASFG